MSTRTWSIVLSALLIFSATLAVVPSVAAHSGGSAPAAVETPASAPLATPAEPLAPTPGAVIGTALYNALGYYTDDFYIGETGWGTLTFAVYDAVDAAVNVTITDPNAARDGVSIPAFHYEAILNATTHEFYAYEVNVGYTFPSTVPYGGQWLINFSAPSAGYVNETINLYKYYVDLESSISSGSVLPGTAFSLAWWLLLQSNGATLYTGATGIFLDAHYYGNGTYQNLFASGIETLTTGSTGTFSGQVPLNATPDTTVSFEFWAVTNLSGTIVENETASVSIAVGALHVENYGISPYAAYCLGYRYTYFPLNSLVAGCVEVESDYFGQLTAVAGVPVTIQYWNGTAHVNPTGGAATSATTNAAGAVTTTFNGTSPPFVTEFQWPGVDAVNFTVHLPGADTTGYAWTIWENLTWTLYPGSSASGIVSVTLDHTDYYAGATATATWSVQSSDPALTGTITPSFWCAATDYYCSGTVASGNLSATAQSGTFTFPITTAEVGSTIYVFVFAGNASDEFDGFAYADVISPTLLLSPNEAYYSAGTSPSVTASVYGGSAATGATIGYQVWGYWSDSDAIVASGSIANGSSFSIPISSSTPPLELEVYAWASVNGIVLASADTGLSLAQGYTVSLGIATASSYSDGSYQPGQTITLSYRVASIGGAALPQTFDFLLVAPGYPIYREFSNVAPSGSFAFTIPSNAPGGALVVELEVGGTLSAGTCVPTGSCEGITAIPVNPHPSALNLELGAGSGLTVGWLILLVLIVLVAIVGYLMLRRRGGSSSGSPPAEWREPNASSAPAGSTNPPPPPPPAAETPPALPNPPAGGSS
jgi:hypothetical protein